MIFSVNTQTTNYNMPDLYILTHVSSSKIKIKNK